MGKKLEVAYARMDEDEKAEVRRRAKAAGLSMSEFMRRSALGGVAAPSSGESPAPSSSPAPAPTPPPAPPSSSGRAPPRLEVHHVEELGPDAYYQETGALRA